MGETNRLNKDDRAPRSAFTSASGTDRRFLRSYRELLLGQYALIVSRHLAAVPVAPAVAPPAPVAPAPAPAAAAPNPRDVAITELRVAKATRLAEEIKAKSIDETSWETLYSLESALLDLVPDDELDRYAWSIRSEFKELATASEYKDYLDSKPDDIKDDKKKLRADLVKLQQEIHWKYVTTWVFEQYRGRLSYAVLGVSLGAVFLAYLATLLETYFAEGGLNTPLIAVILTMGLLGGLTSTLQRIHAAKMEGNADIDLARLLQGNAGLLGSPLLGTIFAALLFLLFAGKLLEGGVFPKVSFEMIFSFNAVDFDGTEFAKLLVWCFIAGFAEKFVPDKLTAMTQNANNPPPANPA